MSPIRLAVLPAASVLLAGIASFRQAHADGEMVRFPADYAKGVHYATVNRGNIREELFTSREAIEAVKAGRPMPSGTVITMEDHRDGELYRQWWDVWAEQERVLFDAEQTRAAADVVLE